MGSMTKRSTSLESTFSKQCALPWRRSRRAAAGEPWQAQSLCVSPRTTVTYASNVTLLPSDVNAARGCSAARRGAERRSADRGAARRAARPAA
jgi:hypothetical protein